MLRVDWSPVCTETVRETRSVSTRAGWAAVGLTTLAIAALAACTEPSRTRIAAAPICAPLAAPAYAWIPGATITIGADAMLPEEGPPRRATVAGFWLARHEVTNAQFAAFVAATGYVTVAEHAPPPLPGAPPAMRLPGSAVFTLPTAADSRWWTWVPGAQWRKPGGPGTDSAARPRDPVVQIALADAQAYARWAGKALPTEQQWELAARSGGASAQEPVGADGAFKANVYQGAFPARDLGIDGFRGRAPVGCFPGDAHGVHDLIGNVWEWTSSNHDADRTIVKGGSFLCADNYCARYRPAARQFQERTLGTDHIGFRLIDAKRLPPHTRNST